MTARAVLQYTATWTATGKSCWYPKYRIMPEGGKIRHGPKHHPDTAHDEHHAAEHQTDDAQFDEVRKHTALQIAAAFGIKPHQINDMEKSSYASA